MSRTFNKISQTTSELRARLAQYIAISAILKINGLNCDKWLPVHTCKNSFMVFNKLNIALFAFDQSDGPL